MKKLKLFGILGLLSLAVIAFCLSIVLAQPSDAVDAKYQRLIALGIVDAVVTPQEVGLDYLQQEPIRISDNSNTLALIYDAEQTTSVMPEDIPILFKTGTNAPVHIGAIPDDTGTPAEVDHLITEGAVDRNGQPHNFTPGNIHDMFAVEYRNGGNLTRTASAENILLADASGTFLQAKRIPVIDLIVFSPQNGRRYVVRGVNANAVCRDALNAVLTRNLGRAQQVF
jgi:hypothetical protein